MSEVENTETTVELSTVIDQVVSTFFSCDRFLLKSKLGRNSIIRALRHALHNGLTDTKLKILNNDEKVLAQYIEAMLNSRVIMQSEMLKNKTNIGDLKNEL